MGEKMGLCLYIYIYIYIYVTGFPYETVMKNRLKPVMFYFSFTEELKPKYRSILKINNARSSDAGLYVCKASLDGHIVQTEARVTIQKQSRQVKSKKYILLGIF